MIYLFTNIEGLILQILSLNGLVWHDRENSKFKVQK